MSDFPAAMPHGAFSEPFPGVYLVTGGFRMGPGLTITRNMVIVKQGDELTLLNSVRLSSEGEQALEALGKPTHLLRVGAFHGADDPYYVDRYKLSLWAPPGTRGAVEAKYALAAGASPIEGARVFAFAHAKRPEVAVTLPNGALVTCDSFQHWTSTEGCSLLGRAIMPLLGFGPAVIGKPWLKAMGMDVRQDFNALLDEPFTHIAPAHGSVLRDDAKAGLKTAISVRFGG